MAQRDKTKTAHPKTHGSRLMDYLSFCNMDSFRNSIYRCSICIYKHKGDFFLASFAPEVIYTVFSAAKHLSAVTTDFSHDFSFRFAFVVLSTSIVPRIFEFCNTIQPLVGRISKNKAKFSNERTPLLQNLKIFRLFSERRPRNRFVLLAVLRCGFFKHVMRICAACTELHVRRILHV